MMVVRGRPVSNNPMLRSLYYFTLKVSSSSDGSGRISGASMGRSPLAF